MSYSNLHNQKNSPKRQHKHTTKRLTEEQVRLLESNFNSGKKLEPERKQQLSRQLGIPPRQIAVWYQNKRARWKNQSLEHDYAMLHLQLETTLRETVQLQKEVEQLRAELNYVKAEQTRRHKYYNNHHRPFMDYSISLCSEEARSLSRSLEEDVNKLYYFGEHDLEVEEMYNTASMMDSNLGVSGSRKNLF